MVKLGRESGLEGGRLTDIVGAFGFFLEGRLVGCVALKRQDQLFTIECLAVAKESRGKGLGRSLVEAIEGEARTNSAKRLWAIARQPVFFERIGYRLGSAGEPGAPSDNSCADCPQYKKSCFPAIVVKDL